MSDRHQFGGPLAITLPDLRGGGAERMMVNLANEIARRDYDVDLVLGRKEGEYIDIVGSKVNVVDLRAPRPPGYTAAGMLPGLVRYLRTQRPVSLLSVLTRLNAISITASIISRTDEKIVVSERSHLSRRTAGADKFRMKLLPILARLTYSHANEIIAISQGVAEDLSRRANISEASINVVHNPAYTEDIDRLATAPCPHPWLEQETPVILGVGSLKKAKDFETLIEAFALVQRHQEARLLILGEGDMRTALEERVNELGIEDRVELPGFVDNPFAYMSRSSVFVLSSAWEGFGNVIVEALACGTPVVSTDCQSGPREILDNGAYGSLVPVGDVESMANAIQRQINTPTNSKRLKRRAQDFSVKTIADKYLEILVPADRSLSIPGN